MRAAKENRSSRTPMTFPFIGRKSSGTGGPAHPAEARDKNANEIEDFGDTDNLMLTQWVSAICATFEEAAALLKRFLAE